MLFIKFFIILPLACSIVLRKKLFNRAGKTTQWLKEFTVLTENPHLDPSNNMVSHNHLLIPTSGDPTLSFGFYRHRECTHIVHRHIRRQNNAYKICFFQRKPLVLLHIFIIECCELLVA